MRNILPFMLLVALTTASFDADFGWNSRDDHDLAEQSYNPQPRGRRKAADADSLGSEAKVMPMLTSADASESSAPSSSSLCPRGLGHTICVLYSWAGERSSAALVGAGCALLVIGGVVARGRRITVRCKLDGATDNALELVGRTGAWPSWLRWGYREEEAGHSYRCANIA